MFPASVARYMKCSPHRGQRIRKPGTAPACGFSRKSQYGQWRLGVLMVGYQRSEIVADFLGAILCQIMDRIVEGRLAAIPLAGGF
jgi:hypothetical protein